jgi:arginase
MIGPVSLLGAPSAIGIRPYDAGGVRRLDLAPGALREQGIGVRIGATDRGDVMPPPRYQDLEKPAGRVRNEADVLSYTHKLASRVSAITERQEFALVLGGDCSILLGALLGLQAHAVSPVGLIYIDAHSDFATLEETPSASPCSMNLALAVGRQADTPLARLRGSAPLIDPARVVHIGARDSGEPYGYAALEPSGLTVLDDAFLRTYGPSSAAQTAMQHLDGTAPGGFWIAVDVDVLDPKVMPAVDTPQPGGLTFSGLSALLTPLIRHPRALGLQVTIYDPTLDPGLEAARQLVDAIEAAFDVGSMA